MCGRNGRNVRQLSASTGCWVGSLQLPLSSEIIGLFDIHSLELPVLHPWGSLHSSIHFAIRPNIHLHQRNSETCLLRSHCCYET